MLIKESEKVVTTIDNVEIITTIYRAFKDFKVVHRVSLYGDDIEDEVTSINVKYEGSRRYVPDIYYNESWEDDEASFAIQTTAYGTIEVDDYITYLEDLKYAYDVAKYLQEYFV